MSPKTASPPSAPSLREQMIGECSAMVRHMVGNGIRVPTPIVQATDQFETALAQNRPVDMAALASAHERLARLVSPAKPGTLALLEVSPAGDGASSLGPVKQMRQLVKVAMVCVAVFILLSVMSLVEAHPEVNLTHLADPDGEDRHGLLIIRIILERVFWLSAAGIGASFAMLFQINDQIISRTYDPDEAPSYWVKFFLGVVAGFILVALVPIDTTADTGAEALGPPTIALLGGFSASAVYRILTRMVEALESIFTGGAREQAAAAEKSASSRAAEESAQARMAVAEQLVGIQQRLATGLTPDEASAQLRQVVASLVPASSGEPGEPEHSRHPAARVPALAVVAAPEADAAPAAAPTPAEAAAPTAKPAAATASEAG